MRVWRTLHAREISKYIVWSLLARTWLENSFHSVFPGKHKEEFHRNSSFLLDLSSWGTMKICWNYQNLLNNSSYKHIIKICVCAEFGLTLWIHEDYSSFKCRRLASQTTWCKHTIPTTRSFYILWRNVCSSVLNNGSPVSQLFIHDITKKYE